METTNGEVHEPMPAWAREMMAGFFRLQQQMAELGTDVSGLRTDVTELRTDVTELRTDVSGLRTEVTELRTDVTELRTDVKELTEHVHDLDHVQGEMNIYLRDFSKSVDRRFDEANRNLDASIEEVHRHVDIRIEDLLSDQRAFREGGREAEHTLAMQGAKILALEENREVVEALVRSHERRIKLLEVSRGSSD